VKFGFDDTQTPQGGPRGLSGTKANFVGLVYVCVI
jgi:hypothetical protein